MAEPFDWHAAWQEQKQKWYQFAPLVMLGMSAIAFLYSAETFYWMFLSMVQGMLLQDFLRDIAERRSKRK